MIRAAIASITLFWIGTTLAFAQFGGMGGGGQFVPSMPRPVRVEIASGETLNGTMNLGQVLVFTQEGTYHIPSDKVKEVRFQIEGIKPIEGQENVTSIAIPGEVNTDKGKAVRGFIKPSNLDLQLDFGTLQLNLKQLRAIVFLPAQSIDAKPLPENNTNRGPSTTGGLKIVPIQGPQIAALMVSGPKITRIAASSSLTGEWVSIPLREETSGQASPIVASNVAAYAIGRYCYAFSSQTQSWDVVELPKGMKAAPIVGPDVVQVQTGNVRHEFQAATGRWKTTNLQALLENALAEKPQADVAP
jgi:hypothetical protein